MEMKMKVLVANPPIKQLFTFQNSEHCYQIHFIKDIECDLTRAYLSSSVQEL